MLRRVVAFLSMAVLMVLTFGSAASAAPGDPGELYPATGVPAVNGQVFLPGEDIPFAAGGFLPGETVEITVTAGPAALRSSGVAFASVLPMAHALQKSTVVADAAGNMSANVPVGLTGAVTITATGLTSGNSATLTVVVKAATVTSAAGQTQPAAVAAAAGGSSGGDGLAYTGTSIVGPLIGGAAALIVGVALLFFGTRMVTRRREHIPTQ